jgi:hypothetical protein
LHIAVARRVFLRRATAFWRFLPIRCPSISRSRCPCTRMSARPKPR